MTTFTYTNPTVGGSADTWGTTLNANWTALGTFLGTLDSAELAVLDGITATTAELNLLDGVTATAAELNILDGVTATAAELNYVDGVTSPIQTQLDAKASTATQSTATWQAGTGTIQSIVSPANVRAAVAAADQLSIAGENSEGYIKMASGLIFQWGTTPPQSGGVSITLPTTYPTAHTGAIASVARTGSITNGNISAYAEPTGPTSLTVVHDGYGPGTDGVSNAVTWLSCGY